MGRERVAGLMDCFNEGVAEMFVFKMAAHGIDKALPEVLAAFFVDGFVAHDGKLVRAGRDENKDGVAVVRFVHPELAEFLLRGSERITTQLAALNVNADLAGSFCFGISNRLHDSIMLELAQEFFRSHSLPARSGAAATKTSATATKAAESSTATGGPTAARAARPPTDEGATKA
jgi:hypothetical protein